MEKHTCPACSAVEMTVFYEQASAPSNSCILLETPEDAIAYPRGRIELGFCDACGFISNLAFDPRLTEYSGRYEETQAYSGTFNKFHRALVERLIKDHGLTGKRILEIGCGKGEFLQLICELGGNDGIGFDPGFRPERLTLSGNQDVRFVQDFYGEKYAHEKADFVCSKMTLEHIPDAGNFIDGVRRAIGDYDSFVFFQIPEAMRIVRDCAFEDIYYEHCSYYSPGSLARLFRRYGFNVLKLATEYDDQYLTIEARPAANGSRLPLAPGEDDLDSLRIAVAAFPARVAKKLEYWRGILDVARGAGQKVALWGSGSKGVAFLTSLDVADEVDHVVDINPHRCGHFMSGTGHPIVAPAELKKLRPDLVIVMNPVYRDEIIAELHGMELDPTVLTL
jgi:SAM-dependent methyltransferase